MVKMGRRNKIKNKLIYFITIPLSLLLILVNVYIIYITIPIQEDNKKIKKEINNSITLNNNINEETNKLQEEIAKLENIDLEIETAKENYYKTLKIFEDKVANKEVNYKIAYLTFDDGPYNLTHKYLEILEQYDVRATFFTIGLDKQLCYDNRNVSCQEVYAKEAKAGHTMANHTYSHLIFNGLYSSTNSFISSVKQQEELIKEKTGITTNIVRFPGGIASSRYLRNSITEELRNMGYGWVDWTASNGDGGYVANGTTAMNNLKNTINEDIEVILFHDYSYVTLSILPEAIEYLRNNNYVLLPLFYESRMINK